MSYHLNLKRPLKGEFVKALDVFKSVNLNDKAIYTENKIRSKI